MAVERPSSTHADYSTPLRLEPVEAECRGWGARLRRALTSALAIVAVTMVMLALVEGFASTFLLSYRLYATRPLAERLYTRYDSLIGWVAMPNRNVPDLYGPGVSLHTNSRGFRGAAEVGVSVPAGKARVVCSGDSFTLGYGVDDEHTWCHLLETLDPRLETVNLGQGGYGLDQAYLWYLRAGVPLQQDVHVVAVISGDYTRMRVQDFYGYRKPVLELRGDSLAVDRVPVPKPRFYAPGRTQLYQALRELRVVALFEKVGRRLAPPVTADSAPTHDPTWRVARHIYANLEATNRANGSLLVIVHLPTQEELSTMESEPWRQLMLEEAERNGWIFVDLVPEMRALPVETVRGMFIQTTGLRYPVAAGHYTKEGNAWVARTLLREMSRQPAIAARIAGASKGVRAPRQAIAQDHAASLEAR